MKDNFKDALSRVLVHEGGWSDHPEDPGGATMKGVTLAVYREFFGQDRTKEQLREISDEELERIYRAGYWEKCGCDDLPGGVDYTVFDGAVNSGPGRSAKWLQAAVGAAQDGAVGPNTLARVESRDAVEVVEGVCDRRLDFLRGLGTWSTFGKGWQKRVEGVRAAAVAMAGGGAPPPEDASVDYPVVRRGDRGPQVRKLQEALGITADGIFGGDTERALIAWQTEHGLAADGVAGPQTYRGLGLLA